MLGIKPQLSSLQVTEIGLLTTTLNAHVTWRWNISTYITVVTREVTFLSTKVPCWLGFKFDPFLPPTRITSF